MSERNIIAELEAAARKKYKNEDWEDGYKRYLASYGQACIWYIISTSIHGRHGMSFPNAQEDFANWCVESNLV